MSNLLCDFGCDFICGLHEGIAERIGAANHLRFVLGVDTELCVILLGYGVPVGIHGGEDHPVDDAVPGRNIALGMGGIVDSIEDAVGVIDNGIILWVRGLELDKAVLDDNARFVCGIILADTVHDGAVIDIVEDAVKDFAPGGVVLDDGDDSRAGLAGMLGGCTRAFLDR